MARAVSLDFPEEGLLLGADEPAPQVGGRHANLSRLAAGLTVATTALLACAAVSLALVPRARAKVMEAEAVRLDGLPLADSDHLVLRLEAKHHNFLADVYDADSVSGAWFGCAAQGDTRGRDVTTQVKQMLGHGTVIMPSGTDFGDPCPGGEKVLLVKVRRREFSSGKSPVACYKTYAGILGTQSGYGGPALGDKAGDMPFTSLPSCAAACRANQRCRSFTACGGLNKCTFLDKVLNVSAGAEVTVVPEGNDCVQYMEVPCDTPFIANSGTPATIRYKDGETADISTFSTWRLVKAWYGDESSPWEVGPRVGAEVTDQVRRMTKGGSGGPKIHTSSYVFGDKAPGKRKVLLIELYQDNDKVIWLRPDASDTWHPKGWSCHNYMQGQDAHWCATVGKENGMEYKLSKGDGTCGPCWCCARVAQTAEIQPPRAETIDIFTVETRRPAGFFAVPGVPSKWMRNVGAGMKWEHGFEAKVKGYLNIASFFHKTDPKKMMILADTDIGFGGCSDGELMERYRKVVAASGGAPVVIGGDPWESPYVPGMESRLLQIMRPRRAAVFRAFGLPIDAWKMYAPRKPPRNDYLMVNSGFIMGPAEHIYRAMKCALDECWEGGDCNDQRGVSWCLLKYPQTMTVDFTGTIVNSIFAMGQSILELKDMKMHNNLANMTQCYIHTDCSTCQEPFFWPNWLTTVTRSFQAVSQ